MHVVERVEAIGRDTNAPWVWHRGEKPRCDVDRSCGMFSAAYYRVARVM
jgi:hypothetical protein